ncbi:MAG: TRAP transporter small permease [Desulfitobacteriaceae bacterium]|nr:TRAP transporter small permease [Desulfitobacteriaceae bacterium]MDI6880584.1 TRAP transporter small permease [Desulfitobacteriaceae bacterium]MDI6914634.1 TRAP transporter small permease [Desulfitobacteriaceae bacterium]
MKGFSEKYKAFEDVISGVFFLSGVTLIFYGVIMRYIFKTPLFWVDEISTYVLVWGTILGWSIAQRDGRHIRVTLLYDKLPIQAQRWVSVFSRTVSLAFCLFLAYLAFLMEVKYIQSQQVSLNMQLPLWIAHIFVPLAALMLGWRYFLELIGLLKNGGREWIQTKIAEKEMGGMGHHGSSSAL